MSKDHGPHSSEMQELSRPGSGWHILALGSPGDLSCLHTCESTLHQGPCLQLWAPTTQKVNTDGSRAPRLEVNSRAGANRLEIQSQQRQLAKMAELGPGVRGHGAHGRGDRGEFPTPTSFPRGQLHDQTQPIPLEDLGPRKLTEAGMYTERE